MLHVFPIVCALLFKCKDTPTSDERVTGEVYKRAKIMKIKYLLSALLLLNVHLLQGCAADLFPGYQPIPQEIRNELSILGASLNPLSRETSPLPDDIGASVRGVDPGFVYAGGLEIIISRYESTQQNNDSGTFLYAFSQQIGDEFELLTNPKFSTPGEPYDTVFIELVKSTYLLEQEPDLTGIADFILDSNTFFVPFNATHLELRYADSEISDPISVERWELTSFYGYNRYLKPLIDASQ